MLFFYRFPTHDRYAGDLETALRSLALHMVLSLVLGDASESGTAAAPSVGGDRGRVGGGGGAVTTTAALLAEYADDVLVSVAQVNYYRSIHVRMYTVACASPVQSTG